jgi:hypothetical protein
MANDVTGAKPVHLDTLLPLRDGEMVQLLRRVARGVENFLTIHDASGEDAEEAHVPDVRLRHRLEHECAERLRLVGVNLDRRISFRALERVHFLHLECIREQLDNGVENCLHAVIELARDAEEREQLHALHGFFHSRDRLFPTDFSSLEISLQ